MSVLTRNAERAFLMPLFANGDAAHYEELPRSHGRTSPLIVAAPGSGRCCGS